MAFSKKENRNPEEWLKEEASWQLGKILDALNAAHTMPLNVPGLKGIWAEITLKYLKEWSPCYL